MALLSSLASSVTLAATLLAAAPGAAQQPFASMDLLWVRPAPMAGAPAPCARLLVLDLPRDWVSGDALAILVTASGEQERSARRIATTLVAEDTAVLHLPTGRGGGVGPCAEAPLDPTHEVLGALVAARRQAGAGLVIALGVGTAGPAVLGAARDSVASEILGPDGPRLAAGIALDRGWRATFRAEAPPHGAEAWGDRAALLCAALADLLGPTGTADCLDALIPGAGNAASLRPPRP